MPSMLLWQPAQAGFSEWIAYRSLFVVAVLASSSIAEHHQVAALGADTEADQGQESS